MFLIIALAIIAYSVVLLLSIFRIARSGNSKEMFVRIVLALFVISLLYVVPKLYVFCCYYSMAKVRFEACHTALAEIYKSGKRQQSPGIHDVEALAYLDNKFYELLCYDSGNWGNQCVIKYGITKYIITHGSFPKKVDQIELVLKRLGFDKYTTRILLYNPVNGDDKIVLARDGPHVIPGLFRDDSKVLLYLYSSGRIEEKKYDGEVVRSSVNIEQQPNFHIAAARADNESINRMINKGVDVNLRNDNGITALHYSIMNMHFETSKLLLERGADINAEDRWGITPSDIAKVWRNPEMLTLIMEHTKKRKENKGEQAPIIRK